MPIFHLAYNVTDLDQARAFYGGLLGCVEGRSTDSWVDFNFFGHQISLHLGEPFETRATGKVGDHMVMMPHLGVVLEMDEWQSFQLDYKKQLCYMEFLLEKLIKKSYFNLSPCQ
jgi:extradiol dioxygenase family protein